MFPIIYHNPINSNLTSLEGIGKIKGKIFSRLLNIYYVYLHYIINL